MIQNGTLPGRITTIVYSQDFSEGLSWWTAYESIVTEIVRSTISKGV